MKKLAFIDALRGLAILCVLMIHTDQYGTTSVARLPQLVIAQGMRGVQLFFLVSAFTLFYSFRHRSSADAKPIRNFYIRRFFRIAPLYYLGIVYYLFQEGLGPRYWLGDETHITPANIVANVLFLHGFNPYWITSVVPGGWSIAVEMLFYAVLPVLFFQVKKLNDAFTAFVMSLLLNAGLRALFTTFPLITDSRLWNDYLIMYLPSQLPVFCLGILLYFVVVANESIRQLSGRSILLLTGLLFAQLITGNQYLFPDYLVFSFGFLGLAYGLSQYRFVGFVNPVVNYIGTISFSLYLVHFAVLHGLTKLGLVDFVADGTLNYLIRFALVLTVSVGVASIVYRVVEVPGQALGQKLIDGLEQRAGRRADSRARVVEVPERH
ncbi:acyltransferase [Spirosoma luteolum]